jgi:hypothetical protein
MSELQKRLNNNLSEQERHKLQVEVALSTAQA